MQYQNWNLKRNKKGNLSRSKLWQHKDDENIQVKLIAAGMNKVVKIEGANRFFENMTFKSPNGSIYEGEFHFNKWDEAKKFAHTIKDVINAVYMTEKQFKSREAPIDLRINVNMDRKGRTITNLSGVGKGIYTGLEIENEMVAPVRVKEILNLGKLDKFYNHYMTNHSSQEGRIYRGGNIDTDADEIGQLVKNLTHKMKSETANFESMQRDIGY